MKVIRLILFLTMFPVISFAQLEQTKLVLTDGIDDGLLKQAIEIMCHGFYKNATRP